MQTIRESIENTLNRYAFCYDIGPIDQIADVWTPDATVTFVTTGPFHGREAVTREMFRRRTMPRYQDGTRPWHVLSNVYVAEECDRQAKVFTFWTFYTIGPDGVPKLRNTGYYDDVFADDGDKWRIQHRVERLTGRVDPSF